LPPARTRTVRFARELGARLTHVAVIAVGCCVGGLFLALFLLGEIIGVCLPGWGE